MQEPVNIRLLKKGDLFTVKPIEQPKDSQVWVRGEYDHRQKKFECYCYGDVNKFRYISPGKDVYVDFIF